MLATSRTGTPIVIHKVIHRLARARCVPVDNPVDKSNLKRSLESDTNARLWTRAPPGGYTGAISSVQLFQCIQLGSDFLFQIHWVKNRQVFERLLKRFSHNIYVEKRCQR